MLQFDEYKVKLNNLKPELEKLGRALDLDAAERELDMLHAQSAADGFWDNVDKAKKVQQRISQLEDKVNAQKKRLAGWDDLMVLCEMGNEEEDESLVAEVEEGYQALLQNMESARLETLLSGEYDDNPAIVSLQAGAGGTEAQDWAQMLYRMYTRWAERHGLTYTILDYQDGDEAGIKSAAIRIEGPHAYGYLKSEHGVHRLVRISPFDANARRQTSFAAVEVTPEIDDSVEVDIRPEDIEMQVYRSSGAGGQHINKTSSAIRVTHLPTGMVVECQDERSQYKNKDKALKVLRSRLLAQKQAEHDSKIAAERRSQVGTGDRSERIRTYNYPQGRLTDHRIGLTLYKLDTILNGVLDEVVDALVTADQAEKLKASTEE